jgi:hypothetical protein
VSRVEGTLRAADRCLAPIHSGATGIKAGKPLLLRRLKQALVRTNEVWLVAGGVLLENKTTRQLNSIISPQRIPTHQAGGEINELIVQYLLYESRFQMLLELLQQCVRNWRIDITLTLSSADRRVHFNPRQRQYGEAIITGARGQPKQALGARLSNVQFD